MWGYELKILHLFANSFGESPRSIPQTYSAILRGSKTSGLPNPWRILLHEASSSWQSHDWWDIALTSSFDILPENGHGLTFASFV
jgi:hypothetical protein